MLLKHFKYEDKLKKKELLFSHGAYLASRRIKDFTILLFQIASFYAEVYVDTEEMEIGYIRAFSSVDELNPYLNSINLSQIFSLLKPV